MLKNFNSYTVDIFINGPLIFLSTVVGISSNGDEPLLNLTTLIFLGTRLDLSKLNNCVQWTDWSTLRLLTEQLVAVGPIDVMAWLINSFFDSKGQEGNLQCLLT